MQVGCMCVGVDLRDSSFTFFFPQEFLVSNSPDFSVVTIWYCLTCSFIINFLPFQIMVKYK